jgi:hypothetical protein
LEGAKAFELMPITIMIDSPSSGASLGTSFTASGTERGVTGGNPYPAVTGSISNGTNMALGNVTQQPSADNNGSWIMQFTGVPLGTGYTLTVNNSNMDQAQVGNLTVG